MSSVKQIPIIKQNDRYYIWYRSENNGVLAVITEELKKLRGTTKETLHIVKRIPCVKFNNHWYCRIKSGVISLTTCKYIKHKRIIKLLED